MKLLSRRTVLRGGLQAAALSGVPGWAQAAMKPLAEVGRGQVTVTHPVALAQMENTHAVLMGLPNEDLLKPYLAMMGKDAPGEDLGGWYTYFAAFNYHIPQKVGFAPGHALGQWMSALARMYAGCGPGGRDAATREKVMRLRRMFATSGMCDARDAAGFYEKTRFIAYTFEKMCGGLVDAALWAGDRDALKTLAAASEAVAPRLPGKAVDWGTHWRLNKDESYSWDESFTLPENLYRAYSAGGDGRFRTMARQYLLNDAYFYPLAEGGAAAENAIADKHAYSHVNALNSAMQAYFVDGSETHLQAAKNGFALVAAQSFATGGWGPEERLRKPAGDEVYESLAKSHKSFETPCGAYGQMKLTRALLRATRDGRYGDSMERVMWNSLLGALPLRIDGASFYYQDVGWVGKKVYSEHTWPCCSGTLPQAAADYGTCSYLQEPGAVWVNLYWPSILRGTQGGTRWSVEQRTAYPLEETVELRVRVSRPERFALMLRVPGWCEAAQARVNGRVWPGECVQGFMAVRRQWRDGDVVELELPMRVRLERSFARHPNTMAVLRGPLVLMAMTAAQPNLTEAQLLSARRIGTAEWAVVTDAGEMRLRPYIGVKDEAYSTYLKVS